LREPNEHHLAHPIPANPSPVTESNKQIQEQPNRNRSREQIRPLPWRDV